EVDEHLKRLASRKGVKGVVIVNKEGLSIRSTLDTALTKQYSTLFTNLVNMAKSTVHEIDPQNEVTFLRVRTKKHEVMIAPNPDYYFITIFNPQEY
ncbi:dynein light chain roadblock-type 1, isoform CRA_b, partial [Basidiobolus meristosporus CBS 931.73]